MIRIVRTDGRVIKTDQMPDLKGYSKIETPAMRKAQVQAFVAHGGPGRKPFNRDAGNMLGKHFGAPQVAVYGDAVILTKRDRK